MTAKRARDCYHRWLSGDTLSLDELSAALAWRSTVDAVNGMRRKPTTNSLPAINGKIDATE